MFAEYNDYGRSWRKTIRSVVKAPVKAVKTVTKVATKTAGAVVKAPMALVKKPQRQVERSIEAPTIESTIAPQIDAMTQASITPTVQTVQPQQPTLAQIQEMIRMSQQNMQPMQSAPVQQTYTPQQQYYVPPTPAQVQEYNQAQSQPETPYYDEGTYPTSEGQPIQDEFSQQSYDEQEYPVEDFSGYGLDEETTALLVKETMSNPQAAIDAGAKYVAAIQGKPNTTTGNIVTTEPSNPLSNVPTWAWLAIGAVALLALAPKTRGRKKR